MPFGVLPLSPALNSNRLMMDSVGRKKFRSVSLSRGGRWTFGFPGLLIAGVLGVSAGHAQSSEPDVWKFGADLALTATSGNQDFAIFTAGTQLKHLQVEKYEFEIDTQARYGRSDGTEIARKLQGSVKFDFHPEARWSPFFFMQAEHDPIRSLSLRTQGGAGAKYSFVNEDTAELSVSLAALYDREKIVDIPSSTAARWSWRGKAEREFSEKLRLANTTFYQPVWDRGSDYLLTSRTALTTRMTDHLSLSVTHLYERDSTPPADIRPSDQTITIGLRLEL